MHCLAKLIKQESLEVHDWVEGEEEERWAEQDREGSEDENHADEGGKEKLLLHELVIIVPVKNL